VAVPTIVVLRDVSTDGLFVGLTFLVLTFPGSALGFIILPKVFAYYEAIRSNSHQRSHQSRRQKSNRGSVTGVRGSVFVTGLQPSTPPPYTIDSKSGQGSENANTHMDATPNSSCVVGFHSDVETQTAELSSGIQQQEEPSSASHVDTTSNPTTIESPTANSDEAGVSRDYPPEASQPQQPSTKLNNSGSDEISESQLPAP
jgi:hypothetical protein